MSKQWQGFGWGGGDKRGPGPPGGVADNTELGSAYSHSQVPSSLPRRCGGSTGSDSVRYDQWLASRLGAPALTLRAALPKTTPLKPFHSIPEPISPPRFATIAPIVALFSQKLSVNHWPGYLTHCGSAHGNCDNGSCWISLINTVLLLRTIQSWRLASSKRKG